MLRIFPGWYIPGTFQVMVFITDSEILRTVCSLQTCLLRTEADCFLMFKPDNCTIGTTGIFNVSSHLFRHFPVFTNIRTPYTITVWHSLLHFPSSDSTYHVTVAILRAATMLYMEITSHSHFLLYTLLAMSPLNCISSGGVICSAIFQYSRIFILRIQSLFGTHSSIFPAQIVRITSPLRFYALPPCYIWK
nr:unnamed protein product [Callosobruchus analis]